MNDDQLDDLKQFIDSRASQTEALLTDRIEKLEQKVDDGFAGVGEAFETIHAQNDDLDKRVTQLEHKAA